ncbi:MAG: hypothetical protein ACXACC_01560 [Promethearchaeota archaeon]|jgi:hypothetical protein
MGFFPSRLEDNYDNNNHSRFKYRPFKKKPKKKTILIGALLIIGILIALTIFWFWPAWIGPINLQIQLYGNKANANFVDIHFLNFWSSNFIFNKTALIGALIGCVIMSLPPDRILLTVIGTRLRFGKPSYIKSLAFWWTVGFVIFYLLGFTLNIGDQSFAWTAYLIENGEIQLSPTIIFDAFNVIFNETNQDFLTIFTYGKLLLPIIIFIFCVLIFRISLNIVKNLYLRRNDFYILANALIIIGLLFGIWFFFLPRSAFWNLVFLFAHASIRWNKSHPNLVYLVCIYNSKYFGYPFLYIWKKIIF